MLRSQKRILTTHVGSLPRPPELVTQLLAIENGQSVDSKTLEDQIEAATNDIVEKQVRAGIDIVNDGEQGKPNYTNYIKNRLNGFGKEDTVRLVSRDARDFPEFFASTTHRQVFSPYCTGPISWKDFGAVTADIARLTSAAARIGVTPDHVFISSVSPGQAARWMGNRFYGSHREYLFALSSVLKREYDAIAAAGFTLQLDCPDLASGWNSHFSDLTLPQFLDRVAMHIEAINQATSDIRPEQLRLHVCWGNYAGPHTHDIPLRDIIELVLQCRASGIGVEASNPRHEHEWRVFREVKLPAGKVVIPGVVDSVSNFVDHPRTIADRIVRYADVVGRENVIAGTDCGFSTSAGRPSVHPTIAWAKLRSLAEGAKLATADLWP